MEKVVMIIIIKRTGNPSFMCMLVKRARRKLNRLKKKLKTKKKRTNKKGIHQTKKKVILKYEEKIIHKDRKKRRPNGLLSTYLSLLCLRLLYLYIFVHNTRLHTFHI